MLSFFGNSDEETLHLIAVAADQSHSDQCFRLKRASKLRLAQGTLFFFLGGGVSSVGVS